MKSAYPDPTSDDPAWVVVDIEPRTPLAQPVSLATIKRDPELKEIQLIRRGRLSVVPLSPAEFARILELGQTKAPKAAARATAQSTAQSKSRATPRRATD